uniref:ORF146 n=2 Tax=root TaxID=1 RepID=H9T7U3_9ZZZZ|nr:ORF146 [unidentified]AFS52023.1 DekiORF146 [Dendrolimus kikuchii nucleopolyhedrovirus]
MFYLQVSHTYIMQYYKIKMTTQNDDNVAANINNNNNKIRHVIDGTLYDCVPAYSEQDVPEEELALHIQRKSPQSVHRNYNISLPQGPITLTTPLPLHRNSTPLPLHRNRETSRPTMRIQPFAVREAAAAAAAAAEAAAEAAEIAATVAAAEFAEAEFAEAEAEFFPTTHNMRNVIPHLDPALNPAFAPAPVFSDAPQRFGLHNYFADYSDRRVHINYLDRLRLSLDRQLTNNLITEDGANAILQEQIMMRRITELEADDIRVFLNI